MDAPSGASQGSRMLENSSSNEDLPRFMDPIKRKSIMSNRESGRRSRLRKQKHMDDLRAQVKHLRQENNKILTNVKITVQHCLNIENENTILRAQVAELTHRLKSLNEIIDFISPSNQVSETVHFEDTNQVLIADCFMNPTPVNSINENQPSIRASADTLSTNFHIRN